MEPTLKQSRIASGSALERGRLDAVMEGLTSEGASAQSLADVAHDARNMVAALSVYCDLLEEPGVLARPFAHYGSELRLVTAASRRLVEKLMALHAQPTQDKQLKAASDRGASDRAAPGTAAGRRQRMASADSTPAIPIANLAEELLANRNLLAALAGPSITVTVQANGGAKPVRMTGEDLTRVLVNLVKNAAEAMQGAGRVRISLTERAARAGMPPRLVIAVEDSGPGIPEKLLEKVFERGYTTHTFKATGEGGWPTPHRGLGLAISRSVVEAAGGHLVAGRSGASGTHLEMELPVQGAGVRTDNGGIGGFVVS